MSAFTDQIDVDNGAVFLNLEEFGAAHDVNGTEITCVVDTDLDQPRTSGAREIEGVVADQVRLFAEADGFPPPLFIGGILTLDGEPRPWDVLSIAEDLGIYTITLNRKKS